MEERNDLFIQVSRINVEHFMHSSPVLMVGCGMRSNIDHLGYGISIQVSVDNHNARHYNMRGSRRCGVGTGGEDPRENHKAVGFLKKSDIGPPKNHKATQLTFSI